jgi:hypothetical protein
MLNDDHRPASLVSRGVQAQFLPGVHMAYSFLFLIKDKVLNINTTGYSKGAF